MTSPDRSEQSDTGPEKPARAHSPAALDENPHRIIRLRLVPWDVVLTLVLLAILLYLTTMTSWTTQLFAFAENVCQGDDCPPVPFGLNYYILPLMWGGIGAAITAAVLGPFVSLLRGWLMCFWPVVSVGALTLASVAGYALAGFSERFGH